MENTVPIRYRTETFAGSGERDAAKVMAFETFEFGNTDILECLCNTVLKNNLLSETMQSFIDELDRNGFVDDMFTDEKVDFFKTVLSEIEAQTGVSVKYALWLADKEAVTNRRFYGRNMADASDFDSYEVGPVVLSDLGYDGTLYGYTELPISLEEQYEDLKDQMVDLINEMESVTLSSKRSAWLEERYQEVDNRLSYIRKNLDSKTKPTTALEGQIGAAEQNAQKQTNRETPIERTDFVLYE